MRGTRRNFLHSAIVIGAATLGRSPLTGAEAPAGTKLGIGNSSYGIHARLHRDEGFSDPLRFVEFCHARGAGGVQCPIGVRDEAYTTRLRRRVEELGIFLEGSVTTPRDESGAAQFDEEVTTAKRAGADVIRTVMLGSRRYETFRTVEEFRAFKEQYWRRLQIVEPIVARHGLRLAVENHKDLRADEQVDLLQRLSSEHVGACVDTGNNLSLLETPLETARTLAPWTMSCHLKDMAVESYPEGFLLSEVPLGDGVLKLREIVDTLRGRRPEIHFNLEMITRDPLRIPCLTEGYWATLFEVPMSRTRTGMEYVRERFSKSPLPRISSLAEAAQLSREDENVVASVRFARERLRL